MINSINFYSSNSLYGQGSNYSYTPTSSGGNYLDSLFNTGMQVLLTAIAKQQLQALVKNNSGSTAEKEEADKEAKSSTGNSDASYAEHESSCHCICPKQDAKNQDEEQQDSEPDEIQVLQDMIQQLQQQTAYQAVMQQSGQFNDYLAASFSDRQIIRSIQIEGGKVLRQYDDYFLAEDYDGNQYTVSRSPSSSFQEQ